MLEQLFSTGDGSPGLEDKLALMQMIRGSSRDRGRQLDQLVLEQLGRLHEGVSEARQNQEQLRVLVENLLLPPWFPGVLVRLLDGTPSRALVMQGGAQRIVGFAEGIDPSELVAGDEIFLAKGSTSSSGARRSAYPAAARRRCSSAMPPTGASS